MRVYLVLVAVAIIAALTYGCANPAANKPKADVGNAAPESSPKQAGTEALAITSETSRVEFIAAKVTRSHYGSFKRFAGNIELAGDNVTNSRVSVDIEADSVVVDEEKLTAHLKTADFFDVAKFPKATFTSTKIEPGPAGGQYKVTGNFELHGIKKSISFPATIQVAEDYVSVDAEFSINRQDFGLVYPGKADDLIRDGVVIKLTLKVPQANRKALL